MKRLKTIIFITISALSLGSCKKALVETPYDFINPGQLGTTEADAKLYVNGALNAINGGSMFQYGAFPKVLELDHDDITGPDWGMGDFGAGNFTAFWGINTMWSGPYTLIKRANFGIYKITPMGFDEKAKNNALGQLNFLKAWGYFLLVRAYGDVPLYKISLEEGAAPQMPRAPIKEVYEYIIETLKLAESQLYSVKDGKYEVGRISKGAASTLLAKVYLQMASGALSGAQITVMTGPALRTVGTTKVRIAMPVPMTFTKSVVAGYESFDAKTYFKLARDKAMDVITSKDYDLYPTYMDTWKLANRNKLEHIWSLQALSGDEELGNTISKEYLGVLKTAMTNISLDAPQTLSGRWYGVRDHWYELFEPDDQRITDGILHRWQDANGFYRFFPGKFSDIVKGVDVSPAALAIKARYGFQSSDSYVANSFHIGMLRKFAGVTDPTIDRQDFAFPFLRYADVLLMFAEADNEYNNGPTTDAYTYLNKVRLRSNASEAKNLNLESFRSMVIEERRRELASEGNRRWDLIRWGIYLQVMNAVDIDENNVLKRRQERHLLYPIPLDELSANKLITGNNKGW
jgi:hypothetical protein